jgi:hypothetical protein
MKLLAILISVTLGLGLCGCALTEEQAARLSALQARAESLKAEYDGLKTQYDVIAEKAQAGELPLAEALKLGQEILAKRDAIGADFNGIGAEIQALKDAPGSKWAVIGAVLGQVLTLATGLKFVRSNGILKTALGVTARGLDAATKGEGGEFIRAELSKVSMNEATMKALTRPLRKKVV